MEGDAPVSKTRRKKAVHELQALGEALVGLSEAQLAAVEMPERLRDAVQDARRIKGFEARRRQFQFIGKLMRSVDAEPIRAAIDTLRQGRDADTAHFQATELWRERLLADPDALALFVAEHPRANGTRLASLVREARAERAAGRTPRSYRALFQALRSLLQEGEGRSQ